MDSVHFYVFIVICCASRVLTEEVMVSTPIGDIVGDRDDFTFDGSTYTIRSFLGIPYAESPAGDKRFTKPVKKAKFSEKFYAVNEGMSCVQNTKMFPGLDQLPADEDCLNLNIYVPDGASVDDMKAVMVFIYGGGFQFGTQMSYAAGALPALYDVVYVTINYRLNVYGFLSSKEHGLSGNYGLWDQHMAIRWIHDNIASFGGNPEHVTLFGESAGAASVMYQALYDGSKGLFNRIILQSGVVGAYWSYNKHPDSLFNKAVKAVGCERDETPEVMSCLREEEFSFYEAFSTTLSIKDIYLPVKDDDFIKYDPAHVYNMSIPSSMEAMRNFAELDIISGFNSHEGLMDLTMIGQEQGMDMSNLASGLTESDFSTYIGHFDDFTANMFVNKAVRMSVVHKYTNWNNPGDAISRRTHLLDLMSDTGYQVPTIQASSAHAHSSTERHTYMYRFEHRPSFSTSPEWVTGADHGNELAFMLGFPAFLMYAFGIYDAEAGVSNSELELSKSMMRFWTQFAKFGNPNGDDTSDAWPAYEPENGGEYLVLKADSVPFPVGDHFRLEYVNYWNTVYPGLVADMRGASTTNCTYVTGGATSNIPIGLNIILFSSILGSLIVKSW